MVIICILSICLLIGFYALNLFIFYILFEIITLLMFIIILFFGVSHFKIKASFYFILYSLLSSTFILLALYIITQDFGINDYSYIKYTYIYLLFLGFIIKLPLIPFHTWLLEAHAESSTLGSIILASGILKLGVYGIYRFLLIYIKSNNFLYITIIVLCLISIIYTIFMIQRFTNIKQIIAASSIIHISIGIIGLINITNNYVYIGGIMILMHHSLLSAFFFYLCGEIKYLTNSLDITIIKNLLNNNIIYSNFLLYGLLVNISFPITFAFISELIFFIGIYEINIFILLIIFIIIFLNTIYSFWLYNYIMFTDNYININIYNIINIKSSSKLINIIPLVFMLFIFIFALLYCSTIIIYMI